MNAARAREIIWPTFLEGALPRTHVDVHRLLGLASEESHFAGRAAAYLEVADALSRMPGAEPEGVVSLQRVANGYFARARRAHVDLAAMGWIEPLDVAE